MSIAQRSVAGEGDVHPRVAENQSPELDAQARIEFTCDTTNLPWVIFRAVHRATHLHGLPTRSRALLAALARTVDAKRPYAAIFARRELLTGRAMQSMRTFYRSLDDLESAGLITRPPQNRYGQAGLFGRAYLHLTESAAVVLGLVAETHPASQAAPAEVHEGTGPEARGDSLAQPSASVADGAIYKDLYPASQKRQPGTLPADLQRLTSLGFHEFLVFRLMTEARQHGKRLSDVVEVVWDHLKLAHAPINYLRKLLQTPTDFRHQRLARQTAVAASRDAQRLAQQVQEELARCAGRTFFDPAGTRKIVLSTDASMMTLHEAHEAQPRVAAGAWAGGFIDALRRGRIVPATAGLDERFAARRRMQQPPRTPAPTASQPRVLTAAIGERLQELRRLTRAVARTGGAAFA
ncbi:hypothetical protein B0G71_8263 [Paraburkholderia sp. BL27I4N3]|uniref:Replication protein O n=1 Tax=Paraburkholderia sp. BL27I4N3 TaxID=1938805 RepID=UPI000E252AAB|nr:Replication protein O [Paraburkholderia sp. BL27I4N3]REE06583.1 hypothetical protein B0G71_8263 [Paraburkholderia sp. BL27I4N3]